MCIGISFKEFGTLGKRMRWCYCSQSLSWRWLEVAVRTAIRRGLGKGLPCLVCVKDQTRQGWTGPRKTHTFFQALASWFGCSVVLSFTDWKHLAFHQPCVLRRRAALAEVNSPNSYLTHLVDLNVINWGNFWGWILLPTVQLFSSILTLPLEESSF